VKSKKWYTDRGIPYKRGYLLYGPPGNGKTSLCKALASEFNIDILILNLADLNDGNANDTIASISEVAKGDTPSMVVIEDVDSFVEGRKVKKKGLSFSTLLNIFDGVISSEGTILFLTTNIVENLDPALIRPGRIDIKAEISNPREKDIQKYLERFYEKEFEEITFDGVSMSQVQECCVQHKDSPEDAVSQLQELCNEL
jgi:chaperone BCS1